MLRADDAGGVNSGHLPPRLSPGILTMTAAAIIDEIKHLPPVEQEQVVEFVPSLETRCPCSGEKLTEFEKRMVETKDPAEAQRLKEQIVAGFFGDAPDA